MDTGQGTTQTPTRAHACTTQTLQMCANKNTCECSRAEPNVLSQPPHSHAFSSHLSSLSAHTHTHTLSARRTMLFSLVPCVFYCPKRSAVVRNLIQAPNRNHSNPFLWEFFLHAPCTHTHTHTLLLHSTRTHVKWLHIFSLTLKTYCRANGHNDELLLGARVQNTQTHSYIIHFHMKNQLHWLKRDPGNTFVPYYWSSVILNGLTQVFLNHLCLKITNRMLL